MFFRRAIIWSPVEVEYLKSHKDEPISQLSIALAKSRTAVSNKLKELDGKPVKSSNRKTISHIGKRKDLGGLFLRSSWEANVARWLTAQGMAIMYEPKIFVFDGVKHGTVSYVPDFALSTQTNPSIENWIEVKGMLKNSDRTRIRRFKKHYPAEYAKLKVIVGAPNTAADKFFKEMGIPVLAYYKDLDKAFKDKIKGWE